MLLGFRAGSCYNPSFLLPLSRQISPRHIFGEEKFPPKKWQRGCCGVFPGTVCISCVDTWDLWVTWKFRVLRTRSLDVFYLQDLGGLGFSLPMNLQIGVTTPNGVSSDVLLEGAKFESAKTLALERFERLRSSRV